MRFPESFLHFIWQFRLFKALNLFCTTGEPLVILAVGMANKHAGPDFSQAKLSIGERTWIGDVEIHLKSSDWFSHGHQDDPGYVAVILHVVYEHDQPIYRKDGSEIPVLILKDLFPEGLLTNFEGLVNSIHTFPCEKLIHGIDPILVNGVLSRMMIERLAQKSDLVFDQLAKVNGDWESTFYHFLAKSFGFKVNEIPFEFLAASLPLAVIRKHLDHPLQVEALVFGQAGFLFGTFKDAYPQKLKREYRFLQKKYGLIPIGVGAWKFLRMRPQNFPTLRLAQFCALLLKSDRLFSKVLEIEHLPELQQMLKNLPVNPYWKTHYHFQKEAKKVEIQLGSGSVFHLIINAICLFISAYGKYSDQPDLINRGLQLLEKIPAENNVITKSYQQAGVSIDNAFFSQALLQINKYYCVQKKCLNCGIGIKILNQ
ncbi:DUF2851 family protein [Pedobacter gandavensis]|uniref:DUF2851 family protein n=1 Tax=Pedobacter gandavensis TaxID=2679963 RepID=A0ABR6EVA0_9SPHI|nr:DUF2851 family protein [Pedobacter gandavensis]MBB2149195.1 DUF2851 family protein [Pedobacter gandavensis]